MAPENWCHQLGAQGHQYFAPLPGDAVELQHPGRVGQPRSALRAFDAGHGDGVAHGWSHGPVGATVAAWPAASLVGSYELLIWLIRAAAAGTVVREPAADQPCGPANRPVAGLRLVPVPAADAPVRRARRAISPRPVSRTTAA